MTKRLLQLFTLVVAATLPLPAQSGGTGGSAAQNSNAAPWMLVTPLPTVTSVRLVQ